MWPDRPSMIFLNKEEVGLGRGQIARGHLAAAVVPLKLVTNLLAFAQAAERRALNGRDVHENIGSAFIRLDEAKTLLFVEPLNGSSSHN
jgi:hypothetical protein